MGIEQFLVDAGIAAWDAKGHPHPQTITDAFPNGWAKVDGEWWRTQAVEVEVGDEGETVTAYVLKDGC